MFAIPIIVVVLLAAILIPDPAAAWGPSTHLLIGKNVLDVVSSNGLAIGPVITSHAFDFLYGSIFADMNVGKKFLFFARLAHNWKVGFNLLESAETEANRACAYGYLAHLAADTIAHTDYVPRKLVEQYHLKGKGHIYFEVAFDALLPEDPSRDSKAVVREGSANNDLFLENTLRRTLLSFNSNRRLLKGLLTFNRNNGVRAIRKWRAQNVNSIEPEEVSHYLGYCEETVLDFLERERAGPCYALDPHGKKIIKRAWRLRSSLRRKMRQNTLTPHEVKKALDNIRTFTPKRR